MLSQVFSHDRILVVAVSDRILGRLLRSVWLPSAT
jgi:hypothetical protein